MPDLQPSPIQLAILHLWLNMLSFLIALEIAMGQVLVRNLDDRVIESLKTKAELQGRSLEKSCVTFSPVPTLNAPEKSLRSINCERLCRCSENRCTRSHSAGRDDEFEE